MNNQFDELAKDLAHSVTRRQAFRRFGVGIAGAALASLGLVNNAAADPHFNCDCSAPFLGCKSERGGCFKFCLSRCS